MRTIINRHVRVLASKYRQRAPNSTLPAAQVSTVNRFAARRQVTVANGRLPLSRTRRRDSDHRNFFAQEPDLIDTVDGREIEVRPHG